jgi:hypothetical protein
MRRVIPLLALGLLVGCAESGDFGRPKHALWNDAIVPTSGYALGAYPLEKRSTFRHTDDELELRERTYRFVTPPHDRMGIFAGETVDVTRYHWALASEPSRSQVSRYRRLTEDAAADRGLVLPFRAVAGRVASADDVRLRTGQISPLISGDARYQAELRAGENHLIIDKVRGQLRMRLASYRYALDNLVVEAPSKEAIMAERAILALEAEIAWLDRIPKPQLDCGPCGGMPGGSLAGPNFGRARPGQPPSPPPPAPPMVLKY